MNQLTDRNNGFPRKFRRNRGDGKLMGVCAGIADYFGVDVTLVRVLWVVGTLAGAGVLVLAYILIGLLAEG